ncbi:transcriptional regulator with XRE-family HTH domain [Streptomonospora nanhaiensis]|uniref:Transcriptional regulator with XRE-family HTH domain n=2 Tax=Streptomonospora nanhaiensis TaxID=1323731 RepID=A0A853BV36_9ACTN|nr:helix-turn-helix transcriptional regulator [Streptomonospora nanhaiensis]MBX9387109.1 helix-turn-helix transcriptional regulator [Streptomonospora nanhaiensis]NYI98953.1 transcriptional regulator with XRE-family HTH domain [Streptomonospora nanhaiensis]
MTERVYKQWLRWAGELRRQREMAGKTQAQLGRAAKISRQAISKYEKGTRKPTLDTSVLLDEILSTGGALHQLWRETRGATEGPPEWRDFLAVEREATEIREWEPLLVPGLLQCESYARWIFTRPGTIVDDPDRAVADRVGRLAQLRPGTTVRAVVDEVVLRRVCGSPDVLPSQLDHLLALAETGRILLMVLPMYAPWRPVSTGSFRIMTLTDGRQVAHASYEGGYVVKALPTEVNEFASQFGDLQAESLPPSESIACIRKLRDEFQ